MESHALTDQFFKSWIFSFLIGLALIAALQFFNILGIDRFVRQAPVWLAIAAVCSIDPALRYFGVLKAEIEQHWADFTIATLLGRATGALVGSAFAWAIAVIGT